jgi:D-glycero-alpha-D-manno-heptose-7-phosphate kinase
MGTQRTSVHSRAPVRISLAGGGTDVSPYTEQHGGVVVNLAITRYAYAELELTAEPELFFHSWDTDETASVSGLGGITYDGKLDMLKAATRAMHRYPGGVRLHASASVPPRSGLGGSASLFVAIIGAFNHLEREHRRDLHELAELAWTIERDELKNLGGRQDQYAAAFGGLNFIEFKGHDFVRVNPLKLSSGLVYELERRLLLFYIGERTRASGNIIEKQMAASAAGTNVEALHRTKELALEMKYSLIRGNLDDVGRLLNRAWQEKKRFTDGISDSRIDGIYSRLMEAGALGGKLTGAGGGGHMVVYAPLERRKQILETAGELGLTHIRYTIDFTGLRTWEPPL